MCEAVVGRQIGGSQYVCLTTHNCSGILQCRTWGVGTRVRILKQTTTPVRESQDVKLVKKLKVVDTGEVTGQGQKSQDR